MREDVLELLQKSDKALSIYEIQDKLGINTIDDTKMLGDVLRSLEEEVLVYHSNKDKYMLLENSHLRKGLMRVNKKGFGFVEVNNLDEDVYVSAENMNGAIHDDIVLVEITSKMKLDRLEGRVLKVVKRPVKRYVGEINFVNGKGHITLDDKKIKLNIEVDPADSLNAVDGHKVVVELVKRLNNNLKYQGRVVEIIGHKNDPGVDILSIVHKYNIDIDFPDEVKEEVKELPMTVLEEDLVGRKDLRDEMIFTIDGDDTRDIDDAISIEKMRNGHYKLGVHIADVSYYVKEGSPLDVSAMDRGTSVYLVDRVIPMLPHELSNGICSLNPNVDRLAISCVMEFDTNGKQVDYDIFPSVIRSRKQMTYKNVNSILEKNVVPEGYEEFADTLRTMEEFACILRKMKENIMSELKKQFRPEFLNRIDDIIVFHSLNKEDISQIVKLMCKTLVKRLDEMTIKLEMDEDAIDLIAKSGFDLEYGARPLKRSIQKELENELSELILQGTIKSGDIVEATVKEGKMTFEVK